MTARVVHVTRMGSLVFSGAIWGAFLFWVVV